MSKTLSRLNIEISSSLMYLSVLECARSATRAKNSSFTSESSPANNSRRMFRKRFKIKESVDVRQLACCIVSKWFT